MAVVYRALDERLRRPVALKVMASQWAADEDFRRRFAAEARAAAVVDNPHVIPVFEAGEADGMLFIAMRLVTGTDLTGLLQREGPLPPARALDLLSPVASALDAAHAIGLVHRDVKPGNILIDEAPGRADHVYLADFGLIKGAMSGASLTASGQYLGTPSYSAPEQIQGGPVDGRTDQYALACVAFELLTGRPPFEGNQPLTVLLAHLNDPVPALGERRPDLPAAAGRVLARALAKAPRERYPSCLDFTGRLRHVLGLPPYRAPGRGRPPTAGSVPGAIADRGQPGRRQRRRLLILPLAGAGLVAAVVIPLAVASPSTPKAAGDSSAKSPSAPRQSATPSPATTSSRPYSTLTDPGGTDRGNAASTAFAADGTTLAVADFDANTNGPDIGRLYLWNTTTKRITATLADPASQGVHSVVYAPGDATVAAGDNNGSTYLWSPRTRRITATLTDPGGLSVDAVAFSRDGATLAAADDNGNITGVNWTASVYLWNTRTGKNTAILTDPAAKGIFSVAFSPDGTLAAGDGNGSTYLWNTTTKVISATLPDIDGLGVVAVAFSPDGTILAAGDKNGSTYLWNTATGAAIATLSDPGGSGVAAVAFSPDGTILAAGDTNGSTYLWNTAAKRVTSVLTDPASQGVAAVAFSPDGTILAAGDTNGSTYLWHISR